MLEAGKIAKDSTIEAKKEIKVVFEDNDAGGSQAANFNGILISG